MPFLVKLTHHQLGLSACPANVTDLRMIENLGDKAAVVLLEADDCEAVAGLFDNPWLEGTTGNAASGWAANADDRFFL